jgi:hypothetical protein
MSGFDKVYNDECAALWNPSDDLPIKFEIRRQMYCNLYYVVQRRGGLSIGVQSFEDEAQAIALRDRLQEEHDNDYSVL